MLLIIPTSASVFTSVTLVRALGFRDGALTSGLLLPCVLLNGELLCVSSKCFGAGTFLSGMSRRKSRYLSSEKYGVGTLTCGLPFRYPFYRSFKGMIGTGALPCGLFDRESWYLSSATLPRGLSRPSHI